MEDPDVTGVVYFVQAPDGQIKIGTTGGSPEKRLSELRGGSPISLVLRAAVPGGRKLERALHERFSEDRLHGEWFAPVPELLALIDSVHNGHPIDEDEEVAKAVAEGKTESYSGTRSEVARARLTPKENELYQEGARKAGLSPSEYLRELILSERGMPARIAEIERRLEKVELGIAKRRVEYLESQVAQMLAEKSEGQRDVVSGGPA